MKIGNCYLIESLMTPLTWYLFTPSGNEIEIKVMLKKKSEGMYVRANSYIREELKSKIKEIVMPKEWLIL